MAKRVDPVRVQVNVRLKTPSGKLPGKKMLEQAIVRWAKTGYSGPWIDIRAVHWLNPVRKDPSLAVWKVALAEDVGGKLIRGEKHRTKAAADKRVKKLLEQNPGCKVKIVERKNKKGEVKPRGQFYTFAVVSAEYLRIQIPGEIITGDSIERARRSLRLPELPDETVARLIEIKQSFAAGKRRKGSGPKPNKKRKR